MNKEKHSPHYMLAFQGHAAQLPTLKSSSFVGLVRRQECAPVYPREGRASLVAAAHPRHCGSPLKLGQVRNQPI